ncbi:hypothetical protein VTH06DRAFT_917 [Thermothelomyces fergusii]
MAPRWRSPSRKPPDGPQWPGAAPSALGLQPRPGHGRCLTGGSVGPAAVHDLQVDGLLGCPLAAAATRFRSPETHLAELGPEPTTPQTWSPLDPREAA